MPDVVVLNNGGMLRGSIVELVPGDAVSITLPTGTTRTIPMSEVAYAGPASAAPWNEPAAKSAPSVPETNSDPESPGTEGAKPFITIHAERARLKLVGKEPNLTVHVKSGTAAASVQGKATSIQSDAYTTICTAPCEASLPAGTHELAVSASKERGVVAVETPVQITGPGSLEASYQSRQDTRIAGNLIVAGSLVGGLALMLGSTKSSGGKLNSNMYIGGGLLMIGGGLAGFALTKVSDRATITFIPAVATTPASPAPGKDMQSASLFDAAGLTVVGTF